MDKIKEILDQAGEPQTEEETLEVSFRAFELAEEVIEELQELAR